MILSLKVLTRLKKLLSADLKKKKIIIIVTKNDNNPPALKNM